MATSFGSLTLAMESDGAYRVNLSESRKKKTAVAMHSRLLQLSRQQLSHQQRQEALMRNFKSCLTRPCVFHDDQLRFGVLPTLAGKHLPIKLSAPYVRSAATGEHPQCGHANSKRRKVSSRLSTLGKERSARQEDQRKTVSGNNPALWLDTTERYTAEGRSPCRQQLGGQFVRGAHEGNVRQREVYDSHRRCTTYYSVLGVKADASYQEIRKAFLQLAARWHPDKHGDGNAFLDIQQAYDVLKHTESRRMYDIQVACRALTPLLPTKEAAYLESTSLDATQLEARASVPSEYFNSSGPGVQCVFSPILSLSELSEVEDDISWVNDDSSSTRSPVLPTEAAQREENGLTTGSYCSQFAAEEVQKGETTQLQPVLDAHAESCRGTSPLCWGVTSWTEGFTLVCDRQNEGSASTISVCPTSPANRRSPTWAGAFFSILRELFINPVVPYYAGQKYPHLRCPLELCQRLEYFLKRMQRLRYHRSLFAQPFCIDPRRERSLGEGSSGDIRLTSFERGTPRCCAAYSSYNEDSGATHFGTLSVCRFAGQNECNGCRRLLLEQGGSRGSEYNSPEADATRDCNLAAHALTKHQRCSATNVRIEDTVQGSNWRTNDSEDRVSRGTWWVTSLREELKTDISCKEDAYRYVQLLPPTRYDEAVLRNKKLGSTFTSRTGTVVFSPLRRTGSRTENPVPSSLEKHSYSRAAHLGNGLKRRNVALAGTPKVTHRKCGTAQQFLPVWGIVFFKSRRVLDDLESAARDMCHVLNPQTPPGHRSRSSGVECSSAPSIKMVNSTVTHASRVYNTVSAQCGQKDASLYGERNARRYGACGVSESPSANTSDSATQQKMLNATVTHLMTYSLQRHILCDCLVLLNAPTDQFAKHSFQTTRCNASGGHVCSLEDTRVALRDPRYTAEAFINNGGTEMERRLITNTFLHAPAANGRVNELTVQRLHSTFGSTLATSERTGAEVQNQADTQHEHGISAARVLFPAWVVTILRDDRHCGKACRLRSPFLASPANGACYTVMHPKESTLRWLCHALIKLCPHAAAEV